MSRGQSAHTGSTRQEQTHSTPCLGTVEHRLCEKATRPSKCCATLSPISHIHNHHHYHSDLKRPLPTLATICIFHPHFWAHGCKECHSDVAQCLKCRVYLLAKADARFSMTQLQTTLMISYERLVISASPHEMPKATAFITASTVSPSHVRR